MKIALTGHSLIHCRQQFLGEKLAQLGHEVLIVAPRTWNNQVLEERNLRNLEVIGLPTSSEQMYSFTLSGLDITLKRFEPDVVYCMEEPSTMFAYELFSRRYGNAIMGFHTYENIQLPNSHNKIVEKSNFVIAGNTEAYNLMSKMRQPDGILPIAGINTELFKPEKSIKDIDVIYFGRYVPEKGVEYIKNIPGKSKEFIVLPQKKYEYMPNFINRAKVSVQYPYSTPNWKEQFNSAIAESLSCNVPVVASNENAIKEYYGTCGDCFIIPPKQQEALNMMVTLVGDSTYPCYGRKYVLKNLDNTVIAKKLIKIFEEVI